MMRKRFSIVFAMLAVLGVAFSGPAVAGGTPEQAQAMVERAASLLAANGREEAFKAFDNANGEFVEGDLYVFVLDSSGTTVSHGTNPALIGKNLSKVKDADGKLFIAEILNVANSAGSGWVDYKWPNPTTKKIDAKSSFVKKVGEFVVGVGVYKG